MKPQNNTLTRAAKIVTAFALALGLANIVVSNQLSSQGKNLAEISSQIVTLEKEATYLEQQIAESSALQNLDQRAELVGFYSVKSPLALNPNERVALAW